MKKIQILLSLIAVACLWGSCKKEPNDISVVGKWRLVGSTLDGKNILFKCDTLSTLEFKSDGTLVDFENCTNETTTKTYTVNGNQVKYDDLDHVASISGDTLKLSEFTLLLVFPSEYVYTYKRIAKE